MQASNDDVSFEQWLLRILSDPSSPGTIDLAQCAVLGRRSPSLLTSDELMMLKFALQSNWSRFNLRVLKLCSFDSRGMVDSFSTVTAEGLSFLTETLGTLTALQHLDLSGAKLISFWFARGCFAFLKEHNVRAVARCFSFASQAVGLMSAYVALSFHLSSMHTVSPILLWM